MAKRTIYDEQDENRIEECFCFVRFDVATVSFLHFQVVIDR